MLLDPQSLKQAISDELNVLYHQFGVHADQLNWQRLGNESLLHLYCFSNDLSKSLGTKLIVEMFVKQAGEISMHTFVSTDQLIAKS